MTTPTLNRYLVLYLIPATVMEQWAATDPAERKTAEEKLFGEWSTWKQTHSAMIKNTDGAGKTELVTAAGISATKNDIVMCATIEAESHEAATAIFEHHPHLQIPQASIQIMALRAIEGM